MSSNKVVKTNGAIEIQSHWDIVQFDEDVLLPREEATRKIGPFKWITTVRRPLAIVYYFPVHFSVYTRKISVENVTFGKRPHLLHVLQRSGEIKSWIAERVYEFDLSQLSFAAELFKNSSKRTLIVVPGYMSDFDSQWMHDIKERWLELEDINIILVDWSLGNHFRYKTAVANYRIVSRQITMLLYYLAQVAGEDFESREFRNNLYFVGHSLGAHISGWVGHELKGQVARITGLDPAGPILGTEPEYNRLNVTNAKLVDAIHTNAGVISDAKAGCTSLRAVERGFMKSVKDFLTNMIFCCFPKPASPIADYKRLDSEWYFGINFPVGHLDFYANGGSVQPGCEDKFRVCDHSRATTIYAGAIAFEKHSSQMLESQSRLDMYKLQAFPAGNYEQFQSGQYFANTCPELIARSRKGRTRFYSLASCAIPMDFVSRVDTLKDELSQNYGIKFRSKIGQREPTEQAYFFETTAKQPYVAEQMLLKLHVDRNDCYKCWKRGCHLKIAIKSPSSVSYLDIAPTSMDMVKMGNFYGLAIPFASPVNWLQNHPANRPAAVRALHIATDSNRPSHHDATSNRKSHEEVDLNASDITHNPSVFLRNSLPSRVEIALAYEVSRVRQLVTFLTCVLTGTRKDRCKLNLVRIDVEPIDGWAAVGGNYQSADGFSKSNPLPLSLSNNIAILKLTDTNIYETNHDYAD